MSDSTRKHERIEMVGGPLDGLAFNCIPALVRPEIKIPQRGMHRYIQSDRRNASGVILYDYADSCPR